MKAEPQRRHLDKLNLYVKHVYHRAFVLYDEARAAESFEEMVEKVKTVLRWGNENLWGIGTVGMQPHVLVVSNRLRNVPEEAPAGWHLKTPSNTRPEQWYIKQ